MKRIIATVGTVLALVVSGLAFSPATASTGPSTAGLLKDDLSGSFQTVTTFKDGSYTATTLNAGDYVHVGPAYNTGHYRLITSGPHASKSYTYVRSFQACRFYYGGAEGESCMTGSIAFNAGYAACFNGCTVTSVRGSEDCGTTVGTFPGFDLSVTACRNHLIQTGAHAGSASVAMESDRVCNHVPIGSSCTTHTWHVNAYSNGVITGPYEGVGVA